MSIQGIIDNNVAKNYHNQRTNRDDQSFQYWQFLSEISKKLDVYKQFQVFSYCKNTDDFR